MLTWIKNKLAEHQHRARMRVQVEGFEYAAAEIEDDVACAQLNGYAGPFEDGALDAVRMYRAQRHPDAELIALLRDHPGTWHALPDYYDTCTCKLCQWVRRRDEALARCTT